MKEKTPGVEANRDAYAEIADILMKTSDLSKGELLQIRKSISVKHGLTGLLSNPSIMSLLPQEHRDRFRDILRIKPVRSASGVAVLAVMTKPLVCPPQAQCVYCPGGPKTGSPKAYTGFEPAALRASQNDYDPRRQMQARIRQLEDAGHMVSKAEIIVMGGTFLSYPPGYQENFVKGCFDALNGTRSSSLEEAHKIGETARRRNVGLTVETRPDFCKERHVNMMLQMGATRVEIGVQNPDDETYRIVKRGHTVHDVVESFQVSKDAAYKIVAHMMPGLPSSSPAKDLAGFRMLFEDPRFKPDMLKIYPTLVVDSAELYQWYQEGKYCPYSTETMVNLLAEVKRFVPPWVRIMRVQRDIPANLIAAGVKKSNLRELALTELARRGFKCRCIRCREAGLRFLKMGTEVDASSIKLLRRDYEASGGVEVFLSFEDPSTDTLIGFIRLRRPSEKAHRMEVSGSEACLIRELHVYGEVVPVGARDRDAWQHRGYGSQLMSEAEKIAREEFDAKKTLVLSAIGTREYYRRLGYWLEGPYMAKRL